ncbi:hypothetical protein OAO01_02865 [Oligoflexia bacterium]|nr:hypothetical protein [Oligoflexia bacterium]
MPGRDDIRTDGDEAPAGPSLKLQALQKYARINGLGDNFFDENSAPLSATIMEELGFSESQDSDNMKKLADQGGDIYTDVHRNYGSSNDKQWVPPEQRLELERAISQERLGCLFRAEHNPDLTLKQRRSLLEQAYAKLPVKEFNTIYDNIEKRNLGRAETNQQLRLAFSAFAPDGKVSAEQVKALHAKVKGLPSTYDKARAIRELFGGVNIPEKNQIREDYRRSLHSLTNAVTKIDNALDRTREIPDYDAICDALNGKSTLECELLDRLYKDKKGSDMLADILKAYKAAPDKVIAQLSQKAWPERLAGYFTDDDGLIGRKEVSDEGEKQMERIHLLLKGFDKEEIKKLVVKEFKKLSGDGDSAVESAFNLGPLLRSLGHIEFNFLGMQLKTNGQGETAGLSRLLKGLNPGQKEEVKELLKGHFNIKETTCEDIHKLDKIAPDGFAKRHDLIKNPKEIVDLAKKHIEKFKLDPDLDQEVISFLRTERNSLTEKEIELLDQEIAKQLIPPVTDPPTVPDVTSTEELIDKRFAGKPYAKREALAALSGFSAATVTNRILVRIAKSDPELFRKDVANTDSDDAIAKRLEDLTKIVKEEAIGLSQEQFKEVQVIYSDALEYSGELANQAKGLIVGDGLCKLLDIIHPTSKEIAKWDNPHENYSDDRRYADYRKDDVFTKMATFDLSVILSAQTGSGFEGGDARQDLNAKIEIRSKYPDSFPGEQLPKYPIPSPTEILKSCSPHELLVMEKLLEEHTDTTTLKALRKFKGREGSEALLGSMAIAYNAPQKSEAICSAIINREDLTKLLTTELDRDPALRTNKLELLRKSIPEVVKGLSREDFKKFADGLEGRSAGEKAVLEQILNLAEDEVLKRACELKYSPYRDAREFAQAVDDRIPEDVIDVYNAAKKAIKTTDPQKSDKLALLKDACKESLFAMPDWDLAGAEGKRKQEHVDSVVHVLGPKKTLGAKGVEKLSPAELDVFNARALEILTEAEVETIKSGMKLAYNFWERGKSAAKAAASGDVAELKYHIDEIKGNLSRSSALSEFTSALTEGIHKLASTEFTPEAKMNANKICDQLQGFIPAEDLETIRGALTYGFNPWQQSREYVTTMLAGDMAKAEATIKALRSSPSAPTPLALAAAQVVFYGKVATMQRIAPDTIEFLCKLDSTTLTNIRKLQPPPNTTPSTQVKFLGAILNLEEDKNLQTAINLGWNPYPKAKKLAAAIAANEATEMLDSPKELKKLSTDQRDLLENVCLEEMLAMTHSEMLGPMDGRDSEQREKIVGQLEDFFDDKFNATLNTFNAGMRYGINPWRNIDSLRQALSDPDSKNPLPSMQFISSPNDFSRQAKIALCREVCTQLDVARGLEDAGIKKLNELLNDSSPENARQVAALWQVFGLHDPSNTLLASALKLEFNPWRRKAELMGALESKDIAAVRATMEKINDTDGQYDQRISLIAQIFEAAPQDITKMHSAIQGYDDAKLTELNALRKDTTFAKHAVALANVVQISKNDHLVRAIAYEMNPWERKNGLSAAVKETDPTKRIPGIQAVVDSIGDPTKDPNYDERMKLVTEVCWKDSAHLRDVHTAIAGSWSDANLKGLKGIIDPSKRKGDDIRKLLKVDGNPTLKGAVDHEFSPWDRSRRLAAAFASKQTIELFTIASEVNTPEKLALLKAALPKDFNLHIRKLDDAALKQFSILRSTGTAEAKVLDEVLGLNDPKNALLKDAIEQGYNPWDTRDAIKAAVANADVVKLTAAMQAVKDLNPASYDQRLELLGKIQPANPHAAISALDDGKLQTLKPFLYGATPSPEVMAIRNALNLDDPSRALEKGAIETGFNPWSRATLVNTAIGERSATGVDAVIKDINSSGSASEKEAKMALFRDASRQQLLRLTDAQVLGTRPAVTEPEMAAFKEQLLVLYGETKDDQKIAYAIRGAIHFQWNTFKHAETMNVAFQYRNSETVDAVLFSDIWIHDPAPPPPVDPSVTMANALKSSQRMHLFRRAYGEAFPGSNLEKSVRETRFAPKDGVDLETKKILASLFFSPNGQSLLNPTTGRNLIIRECDPVLSLSTNAGDPESKSFPERDSFRDFQSNLAYFTHFNQPLATDSTGKIQRVSDFDRNKVDEWFDSALCLTKYGKMSTSSLSDDDALAIHRLLTPTDPADTDYRPKVLATYKMLFSETNPALQKNLDDHVAFLKNVKASTP